MSSALLKLLTLAALLCMSFGMANAPALAQPATANHAMAGTGHCDDQPDDDRAADSRMDCTAICAALAATDGPGLSETMKPEVLRCASPIGPFTGVLLEIATPPPKRV